MCRMATSEANFSELRKVEVQLRRIRLPRTSVNKSIREGLTLVLWVPQHLRQPPTSILRR
jgi:hypothetical protein